MSLILWTYDDSPDENWWPVIRQWALFLLCSAFLVMSSLIGIVQRIRKAYTAHYWIGAVINLPSILLSLVFRNPGPFPAGNRLEFWCGFISLTHRQIYQCRCRLCHIGPPRTTQECYNSSSYEVEKQDLCRSINLPRTGVYKRHSRYGLGNT